MNTVNHFIYFLDADSAGIVVASKGAIPRSARAGWSISDLEPNTYCVQGVLPATHSATLVHQSEDFKHLPIARAHKQMMGNKTAGYMK